MKDFNFTNSNGNSYTVTVPNDTTPEQAKIVYERQLNSGLLSAIGPGQALKGLSAIGTRTAATIAGLATVPILQAVSASDVLKQGVASISIGSLNTSQVTGLLAQAQSLTATARLALPSGTSPLAAGIGTYGLSPSQLEQQGFLKPGTVATYFSAGVDPEKLQSLLASPSMWTGKNGVSDLGGFVTNSKLQSEAQQSVMNAGMSQLKKLGVVTGLESAKNLGGLVQAASKFGVTDVAAWAAGKAPAGLVGQINDVAKSGQQAVNLVTNQLGSLPGIGSVASLAKIPALSDNPALKTITDLANAPAMLNKIPGLGSLPTQATSILGGSIAGAAGALSGAASSALSGATGALSSAASGALGSVTGALSGAASSALGGAASALSSLGSTSGAVGSITGQLQGALGGIGGQITGALGNPTAALTGKLNSALSGAIGSVGSSLGGIVGGLGGLLGGAEAAAKAAFNPAGIVGTVDRASVDAAAKSILGDPKIPAIAFGPIVRRFL
jgi:hypothetical protein